MKQILTLILISVVTFGCTDNSSNKKKPSPENSTKSTAPKPASFYNKNGPLLSASELITNKDRAIAFLEALESGDSKVIAKTVNASAKFDHTLLNGNISSFKQFLKDQKGKNYGVDVFRAAQQGNYVFTHSVHHLEVPKAGIELFTFEKGQIVGMTGVLSVIEGINESGNGSISGPTAIENVQKTGLNSKVVKDYVTEFLIHGSVDKLEKFVNEDYKEHSKHSIDGLKYLAKSQKVKAENGFDLYHNNFKSFYGEGNFVLAICDGKLNGNAVEIYDLFRLQDNKISEHWEVVE